MQDPKELTPADRERIAQAAQLLTLATGSGVAEGTIMKVINSNKPKDSGSNRADADALAFAVPLDAA
jgi:hypothetical protein